MFDDPREPDSVVNFPQEFKSQGDMFQNFRAPLIIRVSSLSRKQPKSILSFFYNQKFAAYQYSHRTNPIFPIQKHISPIKIKPRPDRFYVIKNYFKKNQIAKCRQNQFPEDMSGYRVFLGARLIEHKIGHLLGLRHLVINIYESSSKYALIESHPFLSSVGWVSGAYIRENQWENRGITWELIPENYELFIAGLKHATAIYHAAQIPYNQIKGPNSNSFIGWLLDQFELDISKFVPRIACWGTDYWRYFPIQNFIRKPYSNPPFNLQT